jgi:hypothetical protein
MPAEFGVAGELVLLQIESRWIVTFAYRRQVISAAVATTMVIPVGPDPQDVIEVLLVDHAEAIILLNIAGLLRD